MSSSDSRHILQGAANLYKLILKNYQQIGVKANITVRSAVEIVKCQRPGFGTVDILELIFFCKRGCNKYLT